MKKIIRALSGHVVQHVKYHASNLDGMAAELRANFNGPPEVLLKGVFEELTKEGGIEVTLRSGEAVLVPVVMQVESLPGDTSGPPIGKSGFCLETYLMDLRNSPNCPRFVGMLPPGNRPSLSQSSTRTDFGLSAHANSGAATISEWWGDPFIHTLVNEALARNAWKKSDERVDAGRLVEHAIFAVDVFERHDATRNGAWMVLSRILESENPGPSFGDLLSLACGYPNPDGSGIDYEVQHGLLRELSNRVEEISFRPAFEEFGSRAKNDAEKKALEALLHHIQSRCNVPGALGSATPYYYAPFVGHLIEEPPDWWKVLTVEVWQRLLGDERIEPKKAIHLECLETITPQIKGMLPVVAGPVRLRITLPEEADGGSEIKVVRHSSGSKNQREWVLQGNGTIELIDENPPMHRVPLRYFVESGDLKSGSIKVVSMRFWEPGVFVCSRTSTKVSVPKQVKGGKEKIDYEASLTLNGEGRHYLDVFVRPGVKVGDLAIFGGDDEPAEPYGNATVSEVSEDEYGFEADARGECFYQLDLSFPEEGEQVKGKKIRINLSCTEVSPEECGSEFERLIRLNRLREVGRGSTDVSVDRKLRSTDLQGWMLDESQIKHSFYPLVLGPDYAQNWRSRNWNSESETVISQGHFPHDPRPRLDDMNPPIDFIECRLGIAARVRGEDGNGLFESAKLGEWIVGDKAFADLIERYLRSYLDWLEADRASAAWCDISIVTGFESDGTALVNEPDAILMSPLHPVRMAWHALAQSALFLAQKKLPCPAASILDPDCIIDAIALPLRSPSGGLKEKVFFSVESSSDYWAILWNASRLGQILNWAGHPPFDREFGVQVGGISSGFSVSQVHRALDEISELLVAKPVLNVLVSNASGQNNSCNKGLLEWCKENYSSYEDESRTFESLGQRLIQILDERKADARPEDAEISNLADDTLNAVRWFDKGFSGITPDLGIIAQLETAGATHEKTKIGSALGFGGLIRHRVRQQLNAGSGAFLRESRMGVSCPPSGDGLADKLSTSIVKIENLSDAKFGYTFSPSVHSIQALLAKSDFVAVSSAAVDPACFLGGWLEGAYLWDYELPSYSGKAGDSNGYYLLSKIKEVDEETLSTVLARLPNCSDLPKETKSQVIYEVARRGIPTVKGLSSGDSGASGDLGLFIAARLLQDEFSTGDTGGSLLPIVSEEAGVTKIALVIPVDPFQRYLDDLTRAIKKPSNQRPDLLVAGVSITDSKIDCKITPIEVKFRGAKEPMPAIACQDALLQAKSLAELFQSLRDMASDQDLVIWRMAFQHLLTSVLAFGLRVYSQQKSILRKADLWANYHSRLAEAIYSGTFSPEIDPVGRLIVVDGSPLSTPRDIDNDGFNETMVISHKDASLILKGEAQGVYQAVKAKVLDWKLMSGQTIQEKASNTLLGKDVLDEPKAESDKPITVGPPESQLMSRPTTEVVSTAKVEKPNNMVEQSAVEVAGNAGINLLIGDTVDGFDVKTRHLNLSDTNLNQLNIGVVGDLGTGKTQLLKSLVAQITNAEKLNQGVKPRVLIFDYKKDYSSPEFVAAVNAKVVKPYHLPINLFDLAGAGNSTAPWLDRFKFFADVLDKIFSGVGPVQRAKLKKAVRKAYDDCDSEGRQPTIYDVHANYQVILGNGADTPMAIIDDLVDMEMFSPTPVGTAGFDEFLNGVVVISLDSLGQDDRTKNMLVAIMLNMFYEHMLRISKRPFYGASKDFRVVDSFLLVDEADNIMRYEFDVLRKILLQGREFGVGVILASQYLKHFKTGATDYREPLLTWFIHKVPNITPQELGALGLTGDSVNLSERIKSLALHECLYKTFDVSGEIVKGVPFYKLQDYSK